MASDLVTGSGFGFSELASVNTLYPLTVSKDDFRKSIFELQDFMENMEEGRYSLPHVNHTFAGGVYARECHLEKDIMVVGAIHKMEHLSIISKGIIDVMSEFGVIRYDATEKPVTFVSQPMIKRLVMAVEDTVWTTFHRTDETDVDKIVEAITVESYGGDSCQ